MKTLIDEINNNFTRFFTSFTEKNTDVTTRLSDHKDKFRDSYHRLVSLQAWRAEVIEKVVPSDVVAFFMEAQNDALMSHALARQGAWRVALMSLRSCIENTLYGIYYKDHPVELQLWKAGEFKIGFSEVASYLAKHPDLSKIQESVTGIETIKKEYATLSKAVHGSASSFRVTKNGDIEGLNIYSAADLGAWETREKLTLIGINKILISIFNSHLKGAANLNLRKSISLTIPRKNHSEIKQHFGVTLKEPG